jgi:thiosulfate reductase cytochrome b subunit
MSKQFESYPLWLRFWHWGNALLFTILLISGISMHYAKPAPTIGFRGDVLIHNVSGIFLTFFYCLFLYGNLKLGNGRFYRVLGEDIVPGMFRQGGYYMWGIFTGASHPYPHSEERKFNPLQKLGYISVMYLLFPILVFTGWALLFPDRLPDYTLGFPGLSLWATVHTYFGFFLSLFMVIHIYLGTTGTTLTEFYQFMWYGHPAEHKTSAAAAGEGMTSIKGATAARQK